MVDRFDGAGCSMTAIEQGFWAGILSAASPFPQLSLRFVCRLALAHAVIQKAHLRGEKIGFVFQEYNLLPTLTALENAMLPLRIQPDRVTPEGALAPGTSDTS